jgi:hypothetical protein
MRLSDAGLHQRQTKELYPNHRLPPWPNEDAARDRSNRLLGIAKTSDKISARRDYLLPVPSLILRNLDILT